MTQQVYPSLRQSPNADRCSHTLCVLQAGSIRILVRRHAPAFAPEISSSRSTPWASASGEHIFWATLNPRCCNTTNLFTKFTIAFNTSRALSSFYFHGFCSACVPCEEHQRYSISGIPFNTTSSDTPLGSGCLHFFCFNKLVSRRDPLAAFALPISSLWAAFSESRQGVTRLTGWSRIDGSIIWFCCTSANWTTACTTLLQLPEVAIKSCPFPLPQQAFNLAHVCGMKKSKLGVSGGISSCIVSCFRWTSVGLGRSPPFPPIHRSLGTVWLGKFLLGCGWENGCFQGEDCI
ncbi:hypothetical protein DL546_001561 [Coniochaeta pulveracea]|uniref:Uncharacterized protein n=1 Tax=Coniochaeta pulveracea TaxID=177199 RepID=A0A420Y9Z4_9PEZI|nr:hypothetical protein DL546_001561 [Coniochaeta pulveracea]